MNPIITTTDIMYKMKLLNDKLDDIMNRLGLSGFNRLPITFDKDISSGLVYGESKQHLISPITYCYKTFDGKLVVITRESLYIHGETLNKICARCGDKYKEFIFDKMNDDELT